MTAEEALASELAYNSHGAPASGLAYDTDEPLANELTYTSHSGNGRLSSSVGRNHSASVGPSQNHG